MSSRVSRSTSERPVANSSHLASQLDKQPRVRLFDQEPPLERLSRLGDALGIDLWLKRDDCLPLGMGGNKIRQLEYYLGPGVKADADTLLITGAVQSNFVRLAAAAACRLGWQAHCQLEDRVPHDDPVYHQSGNVLLDRLLGAQLHYYPEGEDEAGADAALDQLAESLRAEGRKPYVIHLGTDHPPLGALGYVRAVPALLQQAEHLGATPDHIVVASGSGQTHSGLVAGLLFTGAEVPVEGICVRRSAALQQPRIAKRVAEVVSLVDPGFFAGAGAAAIEAAIAARVKVDDTVLAPGYGRLNPAVEEAVRLAARLEGVILDPVYTGRAMAGLIHRVRSGAIAKGASVIFIHTGGLPGIFAYQQELLAIIGNETTHERV